ncbi:hypothetical protein GCM10023350_22670 [Nocardioides endophyticus]|uniref:SDR family NAD(P)-dependent oxidoreductase n=1 Tax=Nocardioides endophyticus TaxID=1353775 RepID=A0ABP8YRX0_9ACTN
MQEQEQGGTIVNVSSVFGGSSVIGSGLRPRLLRQRLAGGMPRRGEPPAFLLAAEGAWLDIAAYFPGSHAGILWLLASA